MIEGQDFAVAATVGMRESQQDDWGLHAEPPALEPDARLLAVVADGMGGGPAGDRASALAVGAFMDGYSSLALPIRERLRGAMLQANDAIGLAVEDAPANLPAWAPPSSRRCSSRVGARG